MDDVCHCDGGWGGEDCESVKCDPPCGKEGKCSLVKSEEGGVEVPTCLCNHPYLGVTCEHVSCQNNCNGHGTLNILCNPNDRHG